MQQRSKRQPKVKKTALVQAVDLLARQAHSKKKLTDKLKQRDYEPEEVEMAIERLVERGYLNDEDLCQQQFGRYYDESHYSVKQICYKLMNRGFDDALVRSCIPEYTDEREELAAKRNLQIKYKKAADAAKMMQYLYGKGFSFGIARRAVEAFCQAVEIE
jgi:regulatory protein